MSKHEHDFDDSGCCTGCYYLRPAQPPGAVDLAEIIKPYASQLAAEFMAGRAEGGAALWREIIKENPTVEELRKIAFEMDEKEAAALLKKLYPLAQFMPNLEKKIAAFQHEMRRKR